MISFIPFYITEEIALEIFNKWKGDQWFTPSEFTECHGNLYPFLVPYYNFVASVRSTISGIGSFVETTKYSTSTDGILFFSSNYIYEKQTTVNRPVQCVLNAEYRDIIGCGSIVEEDRELLKEIADWDLTKTVLTRSHIPQLGPSLQWNEVWDKIYPTIIEKEKENKEVKLRQYSGAEKVNKIKIETEIVSLQYYVLYMPVYYYCYTVEGKKYKFFINGQNGHRCGQRPFGIGKIGQGIIDNITGLTKSIINRPNPKRIEDWKTLNEKYK